MNTHVHQMNRKVNFFNTGGKGRLNLILQRIIISVLHWRGGEVWLILPGGHIGWEDSEETQVAITDLWSHV